MKNKQVFLVAKYSTKPRNKFQTYVKDHVKTEENMQWDESVDIVTHIKDKDLSTARIILNITKQSIVKNNFNTDKDFMELFQYFYTSSPQEISHALRRVGIEVSEPEEIKDEQHVSEDVQATSEESSRPEPTATA